MSASPYLVIAFDSLDGNRRVSGLVPVWLRFQAWPSLALTDGPPITELGFGQYLFAWDASLGPALGIVDLGPELADPFDRYVDVAVGYAAPDLTPTQAAAAFASVLHTFGSVLTKSAAGGC